MKLKRSLIKLKKYKKNREKLVYKTNEYTYSFKNYMYIYEGKITIEEADKYQTNLLAEIMNFRKNTKPRSQEKKQEKEIVLENLYHFRVGRENVLNAFETKIFLTKSKGAGILNPDHSKLKILTPKQMLQRLPIALAQVKAGNNSENLLNEIKLFILCINQNKSQKSIK